MNSKPPFEEVYDAHYADVWRFLLHTTADVTTAMEITSTTFFRALRAWPDFQPTRVPIKAWLIRIAIHEWRRELRRRKLSRFLPFSALPEKVTENLTVDESEFSSAGEALEKAEAFRALRQALRRLPKKYEITLLLYYFEDLSLEQVAAVLGRPVGTVKSLIHRAIAQLRRDQGLRNACDVGLDEAKSVTLESST